MSRFVLFLTPILLLPLLSCGGSQHDVQEKYFFVSANTKVPYWQEAAAGFNHAAAQMHVHAEFVGPETYDPKGQHEERHDPCDFVEAGRGGRGDYRGAVLLHEALKN